MAVCSEAADGSGLGQALLGGLAGIPSLPPRLAEQPLFAAQAFIHMYVHAQHAYVHVHVACCMCMCICARACVHLQDIPTLGFGPNPNPNPNPQDIPTLGFGISWGGVDAEASEVSGACARGASS